MQQCKAETILLFAQFAKYSSSLFFLFLAKCFNRFVLLKGAHLFRTASESTVAACKCSQFCMSLAATLGQFACDWQLNGRKTWQVKPPVDAKFACASHQCAAKLPVFCNDAGSINIEIKNEDKS